MPCYWPFPSARCRQITRHDTSTRPKVRDGFRSWWRSLAPKDRAVTRMEQATPADGVGGETRTRLDLLPAHEQEAESIGRELLAIVAQRGTAGQDEKAFIRGRHDAQRTALIKRMRPLLFEFEDTALSHFARGEEVNPSAIDPQLVQVHGESEH